MTQQDDTNLNSSVLGLNKLPGLGQFVLRHLHAIERGMLEVILPNGRRYIFGKEDTGPVGTLRINKYRAVWAFLSRGTLGFGEAYVAKHWESPNVAKLLEIFVINRGQLAQIFAKGRLSRPKERIVHGLRRNSRRRARRNIMAHYDLGNDFYEEWLDESMTYSSAKFTSPEQELREAQYGKYRELIERLDIQSHHRVLEIGCGWGGFAEFAARETGCHVTGLTISEAQHAYATKRLRDAGLSDQTEILYCDYRDCNGRFDRVVSIEMIEAVGEAYWPTYFSKIRDSLLPGGQAGLQVITMEESSFSAYRKKPDFIQRHIFPGGMLLSQQVLMEQIQKAGLGEIAMSHFGRDYGRTLRVWYERFENSWETIEAKGFDEQFRRLWRYYLNYCEAGFMGGSLDVLQVTMRRPN